MIKKILFLIQNPILCFSLARRILFYKFAPIFLPFNKKPTHRQPHILSTKFLDNISLSEVDPSEADQILGGNLNLYSSSKIKVDDPINWQKDYLSKQRFIWSKKFYTQIPYDYPHGVDIKTPWEISRFHHLIPVGLAFVKTKDESYAQYFINQVNDWIKQNPPFYGVNWKCAMEVAIRASNLLLAYDLFKDSIAVSKNQEFQQIFQGSIENHGKYIFSNLENLGVMSNHYMSDLIGLIWIGLLCPKLRESKKWLRYGLGELEKETLHQFYPDGVNFEASTAYHRLVLEMIAFTVLLCQKHNLKFTNLFNKRLEKAFEYTYYYTKPDGNSPQIGDNDSGRFLIFDHYFSWSSLNHTYLFNIAHTLYPNNPLFATKKPSGETINLNSSFDPLKKSNYLKTYLNDKITIANHKNWFLYFDGNPIGQDGNGGHNHDSAGSFELSYRGEPIIVDPGTGCYTSKPEIRNHFRSKAAHNSPQIEKFTTLPPKELFTSDDQYTSVEKIGQKDEIRYLLKSPFYRFVRSIIIHEKLVLEDQVESPKQASFFSRFTLHPSVKVVKLGNKIILNETLLVSSNGQVTIENAEYSKAYNDIIKTKAIKFSHDKKLIITFEPYEKK